MSGEEILIVLLVGLVAGFVASRIVTGRGLGLIGDIVVGVVGSFIAGWLFPRLGLHLGPGIVSAIVSSTIGAIILLVLARLVRGA